jgi:enterochelin esterase-like enzyme
MPAIGRDAIIHLSVDSACLQGNLLGDPTRRLLPVYLPPQYHSEPQRRFAVVYYLAGYMGWGAMKLQDKAWEEPLWQTLDRLIGDGTLPPLIVAFPDCFTRFGGAQYRNSVVLGGYLDHLCDELVAVVDGQLRTLAHRDCRGVMGKSSGGYGALLAAAERPDVFGHACSTAGDSAFELSYRLDLGKCFQQIRKHGSPAAFVEQFFAKPARSGGDITAMMIIAYAQAYSPNPHVPVVYCDLPFDLQTGALVDSVWQRWLACDPVHFGPARADALRSLRTLYLDAGTADEWCLDVGHRILQAALQRADVPCQLEEFEGGHMGIDHRIAVSLQRIAANLPR